MSELKVELYDERSIKSLDWKEHIRLRPGMYIGKLGDGSSHDDGIYVLLKEIIDNAVDEFIMGYGKVIEIKREDKKITVRDYGRGIPLGKLVECVSKINTGAKYDSTVFKKTVGLNGVGTKAVNALSSYFYIKSVRDNNVKIAEFKKGELIYESLETTSNEKTGTEVTWIADEEIFENYHYIDEYIENLIWNYVYLNQGLTIYYNGNKYYSENGLKDLLDANISGTPIYPIIHLKDQDIEVAITHLENKYGEEYYSFVNGQYTSQGGTHLYAFKEAYVKTVREFFKKDYDINDIRNSIVAAISIRIIEPVFESQTKTRLGSFTIEPNGQSIRSFVQDFLKNKLDNYLHKNPETAEALLKKILLSEKERKEMAGIQKIIRENARKVNVYNKKLRDCKVHYNTNHELKLQSTIFITEGESASGSITKSRDVNTQAVFTLKGKPLNCYGLSKKTVYENEEFFMLQDALNIEDGIENLRYNNIVIATDADVDGMHIRLLLLTFFLQFYPDLVKNGHLYILQTPLFRVRNKKQTIYCYNETEKINAIKKLGEDCEITRFKGLGEISPEEFKHFIGKNMRLEPVIMKKNETISSLLQFYMGKNTPERQKFIIEKLRIEDEIII